MRVVRPHGTFLVRGLFVRTTGSYVPTLRKLLMNSILQILKLNDKRSGTKDGRVWEMQDAECVILSADGSVDQVGVLMIPKAFMETITVGTFMGGFALRANTSREGQRRIEAVLTSLSPLKKSGAGYVAVAPEVAK